MSVLPDTPLERIRHHLVGLKMARALEALDANVRRLEEGNISALEFLDELLGEEHSTRESRRIKAQLMTARLTRIKTLEGFDFSFQPSLDRNRIPVIVKVPVASMNKLMRPFPSYLEFRFGQFYWDSDIPPAPGASFWFAHSNVPGVVPSLPDKVPAVAPG